MDEGAAYLVIWILRVNHTSFSACFRAIVAFLQ
jgi:hypothetical protein